MKIKEEAMKSITICRKIAGKPKRLLSPLLIAALTLAPLPAALPKSASEKAAAAGGGR